jgi:hypothetical protein
LAREIKLLTADEPFPLNLRGGAGKLASHEQTIRRAEIIPVVDGIGFDVLPDPGARRSF